MPKTQHQPKAGEPSLRPGTKPTRRRERLRDDRGLRKNTARPETGDPIAKTMNTAGLRHQEASQPHEGKPTRPGQKTRVTHTSAKPRRADNQGLTATTPSYQQKTGSERKNQRKEFKKNSRSLDNHTVGTAKRKQPGQGKESSPPKEGRNPGRTAAYQPKSNKLQRKKPSEAQEKEEGATKSQGDRTAQQRHQKSPTHRSCRWGHRPVTKPPQLKSR